MKVCPVCNALAFDDAMTCFGCLHRFDEGAQDGEVPSIVPVVAEDAPTKKAPSARAQAGASGFSITLTPETDASGAVTWSCAVEAVPC